MTPEAWSIIATGIVVLIAIAASNRSLRGEICQIRTGMEKLNERFNQLETSLTERMHRIEVELRERLARVEGTLDAVRNSINSGNYAKPDDQRPGAGSK